MSGPMGPERLALLREHCDDLAGVTDGRAAYSVDTVAELLADRDHWEAEAKRLAFELETYRVSEPALEAEVERWRARCPVTAEDVKRAGVTWDRALDWCEAQGFIACDPELDTRDGDGMVRLKRPGESCGAVFERLHDGGARFAQSVAYSCNSMSKLLDRPAFAILDEMAAEASP